MPLAILHLAYTINRLRSAEAFVSVCGTSLSGHPLIVDATDDQRTRGRFGHRSTDTACKPRAAERHALS
jgi:hypothetical protein